MLQFVDKYFCYSDSVLAQNFMWASAKFVHKILQVVDLPCSTYIEKSSISVVNR